MEILMDSPRGSFLVTQSRTRFANSFHLLFNMCLADKNLLVFLFPLVCTVLYVCMPSFMMESRIALTFVKLLNYTELLTFVIYFGCFVYIVVFCICSCLFDRKENR